MKQIGTAVGCGHTLAASSSAHDAGVDPEKGVGGPGIAEPDVKPQRGSVQVIKPAAATRRLPSTVITSDIGVKRAARGSAGAKARKGAAAKSSAPHGPSPTEMERVVGEDWHTPPAQVQRSADVDDNEMLDDTLQEARTSEESRSVGLRQDTSEGDHVDSTTSSCASSRPIGSKHRPVVDENDTPHSAARGSADTGRAERRDGVRVMFTGIFPAQSTTSAISRLRGQVVQNPFEATHTVTDKIRRTAKLLCSISLRRCIVTEEWVRASAAASCWLGECSLC